MSHLDKQEPSQEMYNRPGKAKYAKNKGEEKKTGVLFIKGGEKKGEWGVIQQMKEVYMDTFCPLQSRLVI